MKRMISLAAVLMLCLPLTACGKISDTEESDDSGAAESVSLRIWGSQDDQSVLREMCDGFAAAHPEKSYRFSFGVVGEGDAKKMFLDDPDAAADVFHFASDQITDLVAAGALAQIGGAYRTAVKAENSAGSVAAATVRDKLYAFPATADNGYFLYYNKEYFPTAPDTLDDILAACSPEHKFAMKLSDGWYNAAFFLTAGCDFSAEGLIDWDNDRGLSAATAMNTLCRDSRFVNFGADYDASMISGFGDGSVIAAVSGTWTAEKIAREIGEKNLGATKLPKIRLGDQDVQMRGFAGYKLVGVNASSRVPEDAVQLAAWITNEENQLKRFAQRAAGPANIAAAQSEDVRANETLSALSAQLEFSVAQTNVPAAFWAAAEGFGTDLVSGSVSDSALPEKLRTLVNTVNSPVA